MHTSTPDFIQGTSTFSRFQGKKRTNYIFTEDGWIYLVLQGMGIIILKVKNKNENLKRVKKIFKKKERKKKIVKINRVST